MFVNRIMKYLPAAKAEPIAPQAASFAAVPGLFSASASQTHVSAADIYRLAYEAAQQQVAARRELIVNRSRRYLSN